MTRNDDQARPSAPREILVVQYLRGFAAMAVVLFHVLLGVNRHAAGERATSSFGAAGVDLFFVISGFIMFYIIKDKPLHPVSFLRDRAIRVLPLYWLVTVAMFVMPYVSHTIGWSSSLEPEQLVTSLACIGGVHWPGTDGNYPVYRAGWTINYEIFFYLVFAIGMIARVPSRSALAACAILLVLVAVGASGLVHGSVGRFYTASILLDFVFGIGLSHLYSRRATIPTGLAPWALCAGVVILYLLAEAPPRSFVKGLPATLIVASALALEPVARRHRSSFLKLLGDASYSIYLTHLFTVPAAELVLQRLDPVMNSFARIAFICIGAAVAGVGGIACYYLVERPLTGWVRSVMRHATKSASIAA